MGVISGMCSSLYFSISTTSTSIGEASGWDRGILTERIKTKESALHLVLMYNKSIEVNDD